MIVCKCINRKRNKQGKITDYELLTSKGQRIHCTPDELKAYIRAGRIKALNLRLTSDSRLMMLEPNPNIDGINLSRIPELSKNSANIKDDNKLIDNKINNIKIPIKKIYTPSEDKTKFKKSDEIPKFTEIESLRISLINDVMSKAFQDGKYSSTSINSLFRAYISAGSITVDRQYEDKNKVLFTVTSVYRNSKKYGSPFLDVFEAILEVPGKDPYKIRVFRELSGRIYATIYGIIYRFDNFNKEKVARILGQYINALLTRTLAIVKYYKEQDDSDIRNQHKICLDEAVAVEFRTGGHIFNKGFCDTVLIEIPSVGDEDNRIIETSVTDVGMPNGIYSNFIVLDKCIFPMYYIHRTDLDDPNKSDSFATVYKMHWPGLENKLSVDTIAPYKDEFNKGAYNTDKVRNTLELSDTFNLDKLVYLRDSNSKFNTKYLDVADGGISQFCKGSYCRVFEVTLCNIAGIGVFKAKIHKGRCTSLGNRNELWE